MTRTASSRLCQRVLQNPPEWDSSPSGSQESGSVLLESCFNFHRRTRFSVGACTHHGHRVIRTCHVSLHPDLLLPSPPQLLASSPTQLPQLESSGSLPSSHHSLVPHIQPVPGLGHSPFQRALNSTQPLWSHSALQDQTEWSPACLSSHQPPTGFPQHLPRCF